MGVVHIGDKIKHRAKELRIGPTEFAKLINSTKQNIYSIYNRKSLDTQLLEKISTALDYDFFKFYADGKTSSNHKSSSKSNEHSFLKYLDGKPALDFSEELKLDGNFHKMLAERLDAIHDRLDEVTKELFYLKKITQMLEENHRKLNK